MNAERPSMSPLPVNLDEYEELAQGLLPGSLFDFIARGAEDEATLRANRSAFASWSIVPRVLTGVAEPSMATKVLGQEIAWPVLVAPMGLHCLAHPDGERATASAAASTGTIFSLGVAASLPMEEIAAISGQWWFQTYLLRDRGLSLEIVRRAEAAGAGAILLTVDVPVRGRREADMRNRFELPPGISMPNLLPASHDGRALSYFVLTDWDPAITWSDVALLARETTLPVIVKGVLAPDDVRLARSHGARAVVVSNHGGRQLDGAIASLGALPAIVDANQGALELYLDGGVRRGSDILKALAIGARAVLLGRPLLYGLAVDGEAGARRVLELLREEMRVAAVLAGISDLTTIDRSFVVRSS